MFRHRLQKIPRPNRSAQLLSREGILRPISIDQSNSVFVDEIWSAFDALTQSPNSLDRSCTRETSPSSLNTLCASADHAALEI